MRDQKKNTPKVSRKARYFNVELLVSRLQAARRRETELLSVQAEIQRRYREMFEAAVNNLAERGRIYTEYHILHPEIAAADSWCKKIAPQIPLLHSHAMFKLVSDRQAENQERSVIKAKETEAAVVADPAPRIHSAGKRRDEGIEARDHLIATLKESCKSLKGIRRNKRIASGDYHA